jgi:deazaflavin-dependent oxidoreductase (nitroreductase family)
MPVINAALKTRLSKDSEVTITVTGRNSGRASSIPVWFVFDGAKVALLPVHGSDTQWYKNVLKNPRIRIQAGGTQAEFHVVPVTERAQLCSIIEKFRQKYGDSGVKLYSKLDVAAIAEAS